MQSRALEILVGLFVTLGVAAVFILTFRVASLDKVGDSGDSYQVVGQFQNVGGLRVGSAVTLAGVRVGRVTAIDINRNTFEADVTLELASEYDNIPEDSSAKILTAGLLGEQYIGLDPGGLPDPLKDGSVLLATQSALVLENLIGQFVSSQGESEDGELAKALDRLAESLEPQSTGP